MRNSILIFVLISAAFNSFSQHTLRVDTLRFAGDSSYSRVLLMHNDQLYIGTSKSGVIVYDLENNKKKTVLPPVKYGEFRDLSLVDNRVFACVSGDRGMIYSIKKKKYKLVFEKDSMFIDDLVYNPLKGEINVLADPTNNQFELTCMSTSTSKTTNRLSFKTKDAEAFFAASGTTAQMIDSNYYFVSGGPNNATFYCAKLIGDNYEIIQRTELPFDFKNSNGPFSMLMLDKQNGVVVGGNYKEPKIAKNSGLYTHDGGKTWSVAKTTPNGYRSCVIKGVNMLYCCGSNGIDYSTDKGENWNSLLKGNFCALLADGDVLYATSNKGYLLRIEI